TWDNIGKSISINTIGYWKISVEVPDDATKGLYMFNVVACWDRNYDGSDANIVSFTTCLPVADNIWGGSAQPLTVTVN
ncbi:MAG: hypothetical protein JRI49_08435, partial [Deltaproteobacteria bacterium]|nr:hypothetical protein [Deltaproteobacteria bacterium]